MVDEKTPLYPLRFEPIYKEKVWGGRTLERLGRQLPGNEETKIGESWELCDLGQTSVSGGGGGEARSRVADGPLAGRTLHELMTVHGQRLMGRLRPTPTGDFPLLVKFLDARENLSVQVHPSEAYAAKHPQAQLKSEAWYIVHAEPGAVIYKGIKEGVTPQAFRQALEVNSVEAVEPLLVKVPVKAGDCHYLPSGTCHALGAGVLVAEVQTPSDTTFRVFDWGRQGRQLHVEQALQCIEFGPSPTARHERRSHIAGVFTTVSRLVTCDFFRIERIRMSEGYRQELPYDQPVVWIVLAGRGRLLLTADDPHPTVFERGQTLLIPAGMNQAHVELLEDTQWLEVSFPQAQPEQIA